MAYLEEAAYESPTVAHDPIKELHAEFSKRAEQIGSEATHLEAQAAAARRMQRAYVAAVNALDQQQKPTGA